MTNKSSIMTPIFLLVILGVGVFIILKLAEEFKGFGGILNATLDATLGDVGRGLTQGAEVGGLSGAVGGGIYETFTTHTETLKERIETRVEDTGEDWTEAGVHEVAEDIHDAPFDTGFVGAVSPIFAPFTIGAGIAAIQKWGEWLETLSPEERRKERWTEYAKREQFIQEHPLEVATSFIVPPVGLFGLLYHKLTSPTRDIKEFPTPVLQNLVSREAENVFEELYIKHGEKILEERNESIDTTSHEPQPETIRVVIDKTPADFQPLPPPPPPPKDVVYVEKYQAVGTAEQIADKYGDF